MTCGYSCLRVTLRHSHYSDLDCQRQRQSSHATYSPLKTGGATSYQIVSFVLPATRNWPVGYGRERALVSVEPVHVPAPALGPALELEHVLELAPGLEHALLHALELALEQ